jgi:hypothetical protein
LQLIASPFWGFFGNSATFDRRKSAGWPRPEIGSIATAWLARSSSPLSPTTQSCANGDFPVQCESPRTGGDLTNLRRQFLLGMRDLCYVEERHFKMEDRNADGHLDRLRSRATMLLHS